MQLGTSEKGKLGELYVLSRLLEMGVIPFIPLVDIKGVDTVIRRTDGTYVEIQVKATYPPEQAGYFNVPGLVPCDNLFIVGIIMGAGKPEVWIIPSKVYVESTGERRLLSLGTGDTKHSKDLRNRLAIYREAWHLLTG
jgi:hypothetical protein